MFPFPSKSKQNIRSKKAGTKYQFKINGWWGNIWVSSVKNENKEITILLLSYREQPSYIDIEKIYLSGKLC